MTTTLTAPTAPTARPAAVEQVRLVTTVTLADLLAPAAVPALAADELVAHLGGPSVGSPSRVVGRRTDGRPSDHVVLEYRADGGVERRTWTLVADHGAEATYRLTEDTGARGGFAALRR